MSHWQLFSNAMQCILTGAKCNWTRFITSMETFSLECRSRYATWSAVYSASHAEYVGVLFKFKHIQRSLGHHWCWFCRSAESFRVLEAGSVACRRFITLPWLSLSAQSVGISGGCARWLWRDKPRTNNDATMEPQRRKRIQREALYGVPRLPERMNCSPRVFRRSAVLCLATSVSLCCGPFYSFIISPCLRYSASRRAAQGEESDS